MSPKKEQSAEKRVKVSPPKKNEIEAIFEEEPRARVLREKNEDSVQYDRIPEK